MEGFILFVATKGMDRKDKWVPFLEKQNVETADKLVGRGGGLSI